MKIAPVLLPQIQQKIFRSLLKSMSRPGTICDLSPHIGQESAAIGVLATLLDHSLTLADPAALLDTRRWTLLGARKCRPEEAAFIVCPADRKPDFSPRLGTLESPELSATVVLCCPGLGQDGAAYALSGPGINGKAALHLAGVDRAWFSQRQQWTACYPLGVDLIIAGEGRVAAIPRSTVMEEISV